MNVDGHDCYYDDAGHIYMIDGLEVISVTQALVEASIIDTKWYTEWARHRGSRVHKAIELLVKGTLDTDSLDPRIRGYVDAYERFVDETGFVCLEVERKIWSPHSRFAGTLDQWGVFRGGHTALVDTKTGALQPATGLQLSGYEDGRNQETGEHTDRLLGLQLKVDGYYSIKPYKYQKQDWRAALRVAWWKRVN